MDDSNHGFACLEDKHVLLLEERLNEDSSRIHARAAWCLTAPIHDDDNLLRLIHDTDIEAFVLNDVLAKTASITALLGQINQRLRPGGCLMVCEPYWSIDPIHEEARIQALLHLRDHMHQDSYRPIWQRGQLYSIMQGLNLTGITFDSTASDVTDLPEHPFQSIVHQLPASSLPHIRIGRMRMWGHKPTHAT